jgi:hypothetical protein
LPITTNSLVSRQALKEREGEKSERENETLKQKHTPFNRDDAFKSTDSQKSPRLDQIGVYINIVFFSSYPT